MASLGSNRGMGNIRFLHPVYRRYNFYHHAGKLVFTCKKVRQSPPKRFLKEAFFVCSFSKAVLFLSDENVLLNISYYGKIFSTQFGLIATAVVVVIL